MGPVTPNQAPPAAAGTQQSRTVLVSFLGAIVRRMGNWMPIAGTIELMGEFGLDAPSVRTAVFRLKKRGWLASETRAGSRGYALTPVALKALAAGDEIIWHARQPADLADGWCIVSFSVPESARSKRDQLRTHLAALGFGNVGAAMWIAPARMRAAADQAIAELGLTSYCAIFVGDYVGGRDLPALLRESWDLAEIDRRYREFTHRFAAEARGLEADGAGDPRRAFLSYLAVIDQWRKLPFRDPGLPREILPEDWSAPAAGALFEGLVAALEPPALKHAANHWPANATPPPPAA
jgi:phenylacetic acid degradation operon negative regulatory protein